MSSSASPSHGSSSAPNSPAATSWTPWVDLFDASSVIADFDAQFADFRASSARTRQTLRTAHDIAETYNLAGELTAASIVVAAKGLLRWPELRSSEGQHAIHRLTEYFLVGSFVSWLVALSSLLLLAR